jgi:DNA-binding transcriptional LysR family regulator
MGVANLNQVAVFLQVVETGSFTAAAQQLGLTPSAVSKNISQLEADLAVRLLVRTTRSLALTDAGTRFFERCKLAVTELRSATDEIQSSESQIRGPLRIHATPGVGQRLLVPVLLPFMKAHPDIRVSLEIGSASTATVSTDVDVFITVTHKGEMRGSRFRSAELADVRYLVCASPTYIDTYGMPASPHDLAQHNCLIQESQRAPRDWRFAQEDNSVTSVRVKGSLATNNAVALEDGVLAGLGVGRIADYAARQHIRDGKLVVLFNNLVAWGQVVTAFFPSGLQSARLQAFIEHLKREIRPAV